MAGRTVSVSRGETLVVGRAVGRVQFALPHDTFMSGVHFAVECGPRGYRVFDKKSSNGTFLNGVKIQEAILANGDQIKSGETTFVVKIVGDDKLSEAASRGSVSSPQVRQLTPVEPSSRPMRRPEVSGDARRAAEPMSPSPSAVTPSSVLSPTVAPATKAPLGTSGSKKSQLPVLSLMGWSFFEIPAQWQVQEGFGLQESAQDKFPSTVVVSREHLGGISLAQFVESQISTLRRYLSNAQIEPAMPPQILGAEETLAFDVHHSTKDGKELVYRRIYARTGSSVGVLNITTQASDLVRVLDSLQPLLASVVFVSSSGQ